MVHFSWSLALLLLLPLCLHSMTISNGFTQFHKPSKSEYSIYKQVKHKLNKRAKLDKSNKWSLLEVASHVVSGTNYYFNIKATSGDIYVLLVYIPLPNEDNTMTRIISLNQRHQEKQNTTTSTRKTVEINPS